MERKSKLRKNMGDSAPLSTPVSTMVTLKTTGSWSLKMRFWGFVWKTFSGSLNDTVSFDPNVDYKASIPLAKGFVATVEASVNGATVALKIELDGLPVWSGEYDLATLLKNPKTLKGWSRFGLTISDITLVATESGTVGIGYPVTRPVPPQQ